MKVYVGHSKDIDYQELYSAILNSKLSSNHEFIFPHQKSINSTNGRDFYKKEFIDIFIAEVSKPALGLGIELGFAYDEKIPIYCFCKKGSSVTKAISSVTTNLIEYQTLEDFLNKLENILQN